jgi:3-dehydroquinate synthetase
MIDLHLDDPDLAPELTLEMNAPFTVSYEIRHTRGPVFDLDDNHLVELLGKQPVLVVVDAGIWPTYGRDIRSYVTSRLNCKGIIPIPGTESSKSLAAAAALCEAAIDARIPRDGVFVAVGGGTVMDVVGFAASIFRRGIGFVRVPTTLIGMIDVGVGIKQAVNVGAKKNIIGSFYPPLGIINDQTFLRTLPRKYLACGIAEAIKIALVCDEHLFELLETYGPTLIATGFQKPAAIAQEVLQRSEAAMIGQLSPNLFEADRRRLVDFGHTFSPTIESASEYDVSHGEAVAMDMLLSCAIGARRGIVSPALPLRLARLLQAIDLRLVHPVMTTGRMNAAVDEMRLHRGGSLNLVVPTEIGTADFLQTVGAEDLDCALTAVRQLQNVTCI